MMNINNVSSERLSYTFVILALVVVVTASCGGGSSTPATTSSIPPTLGVPVIPGSGLVAVSGVTVINQTITTTDTDIGTSLNPYVFPGQANYWDISSDFSLNDGHDDQFDGALQISVNDGVSTANFPADQTQSELTWLTPLTQAADGLKGVAVADATFDLPISGTQSAYITTATADTRLQQTIDLTAATGTVSLTWSAINNVSVSVPLITQSVSAPSTFKVVLRDLSGNLLDTIYSIDSNGNVAGIGTFSGNSGSADITGYAGQTVQLSFEVTGDYDGYSNEIDDVSILDSVSPTNYVLNGDFESGDLTHWTTNVVETSTNFTSGVRSLDGLDVQRSFYTVPDKLWGRWVDVYQNKTPSSIIVTITYTTNLGSDKPPHLGPPLITYPGTYGITYYTPNTSSKALTSWDGSAQDRDLGMVYGTATSVAFDTATALNTLSTGPNGDNIYVTYQVTVPAHGQKSIVNFILMDGTDTGLAHDITAKATEIDTAAAAIVANFRTDPQYRNGMTQAQIDSIINF